MASALIVYGSTTGSTEYAAGVVESILSESGYAVTKENASDVTPAGLCGEYDLVLFGCSTWGEDTIVLQDDFADLFDHFDAIGAKGKNTAVFGCGDKSYPYFCGAVDSISEKLVELGATVLDTLKIDGDPESEAAEIEAWARHVVAAVPA